MTAPLRCPRLTADEILAHVNDQPKIVGPEGLAKLLQLSRKTIYQWLAAGRLNGAARKRGKHWLISTHKAIDEILNGAEWKQ